MKKYLKNFKDFVNENISDDDIESVFGDLGLYSLTQEQIDFLDQYTDGKWSFDRYTNVVDIDGSFNVSGSDIFDFLGINFGKVGGDFSCSHNPGLTSLEGAPDRVGEDFRCNNNPGLTSLEGSPEEVEGDFSCSHNPGLTSLEGAPKKVGGDFWCRHNPNLTSLEGAPNWVGGHFSCDNNPRLRSLEGIGEVKGEIYSDLNY